MDCRSILFAVLAAATVHSAANLDAAVASESVAVDQSLFSALPEAPEPALALSTSFGTEVTPALAFTMACNTDAAAVLATNRRTVLETIRYRPRRYRDRDRDRDRYRDDDDNRPTRRSTGFSQLHGGFFDPDGDATGAFLVGFRGGVGVERNLQMGLGLDWIRKSERAAAIVSEEPLPGGGIAERRLELARTSSNLFPLMAFVQFAPISSGVVPYFGVGGGYEVLFLSAQNFETGEDFDGTFSGWGWQAWGGVAIPLSGKSRLSGEVFRNIAEVERDVDDPSTGQSFREVIDVHGIGARVGLSWGF